MCPKDSCALTLQERVEADLLDRIQHGTYAPGEKIPSEHELSALYGVSRVTVRIALSRLVEKGYLVKRQGRGAFVRPTVHVESTLTSGSFTETCIKTGCAPSTRIICCETRAASPQIKQMLNTDDDQLIEIRRLRLVDGVPCIVEFDYFPLAYRFLLETPLEDRSLFSTIAEHCGTEVGRHTAPQGHRNRTRPFKLCGLRKPAIHRHGPLHLCRGLAQALSAQPSRTDEPCMQPGPERIQADNCTLFVKRGEIAELEPKLTDYAACA